MLQCERKCLPRARTLQGRLLMKCSCDSSSRPLIPTTVDPANRANFRPTLKHRLVGGHGQHRDFTGFVAVAILLARAA